MQNLQNQNIYELLKWNSWTIAFITSFIYEFQNGSIMDIMIVMDSIFIREYWNKIKL
jgi:hypothetical protein